MTDHDLRADSLRRRVAQADDAGHADITVPTAEARSALLLLTCARGAVEHDYRVHGGVVRDLATARARMDRLATATERLLRNASEESVQAVREALADARRVDGRGEAPAEAVLDHLRRWAEDDPEVTTAGNDWLAGYVAAMKRVRELIGAAVSAPPADAALADWMRRLEICSTNYRVAADKKNSDNYKYHAGYADGFDECLRSIKANSEALRARSPAREVRREPRV